MPLKKPSKHLGINIPKKLTVCFECDKTAGTEPTQIPKNNVLMDSPPSSAKKSQTSKTQQTTLATGNLEETL